MNISVTGCAGFIGSHLCDRFLTDGHKVSGLDNLTTGRFDNIDPEVDFLEYDISDGWLPHNRKPDLIIHCAASYKDPDKWHRDTEVNVLGTINATIQAKRHGCPIVYMQTALPPVSSYAISKTAGMQYIQQSGVPYLIFRLANIYGPRNLSGPIPTFYKRLTEGQPCTVVDTTRDMVYIDDLVNCIDVAIDRGVRGVYDVCSGTETSIQELFDAVDVAIDEGLHESSMVSPSHDEAMTQISADGRVPGWEATVPVLTGVERAVEWYRANPPAETFTHLRVEEPNRA